MLLCGIIDLRQIVVYGDDKVHKDSTRGKKLNLNHKVMLQRAKA